MTRLVLGTAQFGSGYGITNDRRRIDDATVTAILRTALDRGIDTFDTAAEYDDSQDRLGALLDRPSPARFITKFTLPEVDADADADAEVTALAMYGASMQRLAVDRLAGLLFHRISDLRDARSGAALDLLREARSAGVIERVGVSIYDRDDLDLVLETFPDLDLLQIPGNVVDRRLLDDTDVAELHDAGVEIHVRSAFLQGLLLAQPQTLDERFAALVPVIESLRGAAADAGSDTVTLLLGALREHPVVDAVLVGATSAAEVTATADAWAAPSVQAFDAGEPLPVSVLDPRRW